MKSVGEVLGDRRLRTQLNAAWQSAIASRADLANFLRLWMNRRIADFDAQEELTILITKVALWTEDGEQWVLEAYQGLCHYRPQHAALKAFGAETGWTPETEQLPALQDLVETPGTRRYVRNYSGEIRRTAECASAIGTVKELHDLVDGLRGKVYLPLREAADRLAEPTGGAVAARLRRHLLEVKREIEERTRPPRFEEGEFPWIDEQLGQAGEELRAAAEAPGAAPVGRAIGYLQDVIEIELTDLDRRIERMTKQLDLASLVDRLRALRDELDAEGLDAERIRALDADIMRLEGIGSHLGSLVGLHGAWQRIDSALSALENSLDLPGDDVSRRWTILDKRMKSACPDGYDALPGLSAAIEAFATALETGDRLRMELDFPAMSTLLRHRFTGIDHELLDQCALISAVGDSLNLVVEKLDG